MQRHIIIEQSLPAIHIWPILVIFAIKSEIITTCLSLAIHSFLLLV